MRKYLFIFKSQVMTNLQYISNVFFGFIICLILYFIFFNLWTYIYSDPNEVINGYTMNQMIWYVIVTETLWNVLSGRRLCAKISSDVKGGNIAYNINKPYSYIGYSLSSHLGDCVIRAIIYVVLGALTGFLFLKGFPSINLLQLLLVFLTGLIATIISTLFSISIGLFSFFIEDSAPFWWVYSKFILVLGTIFPIEYFPKVFQGILRYSPIYVVSYGPARLFVNFSWNECLSILMAQSMYIIIAYLICSLIYKKGVKNLNVNGG